MISFQHSNRSSTFIILFCSLFLLQNSFYLNNELLPLDVILEGVWSLICHLLSFGIIILGCLITFRFAFTIEANLLILNDKIIVFTNKWSRNNEVLIGVVIFVFFIVIVIVIVKIFYVFLIIWILLEIMTFDLLPFESRTKYKLFDCILEGFHGWQFYHSQIIILLLFNFLNVCVLSQSFQLYRITVCSFLWQIYGVFLSNWKLILYFDNTMLICVFSISKNFWLALRETLRCIMNRLSTIFRIGELT